MAAPKPLNPKQEAFALKYVECGNASEAYRSSFLPVDATDESVWSMASRALSDVRVQSRVMELQEEARERSQVTVEGLTKELNEDRKLAREEGQSSAAISAVMAKAKLHGLLVDKSHIKHEGMKVVISGPEADW